MAIPTPTDASLIDAHLLAIEWNDGVTLHYPLDHLRANCPCAHCQGHYEGEKPPQFAEQFRGIALQSLDEVGSYAFQIAFNDGHGLGIYTFPHLRGLGFPEGKAPVAPSPDAFEV